MWSLWLIIVIALSIIEAITIDLVCIWFIISSIVSLFLSFMIDEFYIQFFIFVILGIILMLTTRPILVKKMHKTNVKTNLDRVIGMKGIVTDNIGENQVGSVKVDGKTWSAISKEEIKEGSRVIVDAIDGVKLQVRKDEER